MRLRKLHGNLDGWQLPLPIPPPDNHAEKPIYRRVSPQRTKTYAHLYAQDIHILPPEVDDQLSTETVIPTTTGL